MKKPSYLFVCGQNLYRSPAAEEWLVQYCKDHSLDAEVQSAGIKPWGRINGRGVQLETNHIERADQIFVMEEYMKTFILENYCVEALTGEEAVSSKIVVLDIPDKFDSVDQTHQWFSYEDALAAVHSGKTFGPAAFYKVLEERVGHSLQRDVQRAAVPGPD